MTRPDPEEYVEVQPADHEAAAMLRRVEQILGPDVKVQFALRKARTKPRGEDVENDGKA